MPSQALLWSVEDDIHGLSSQDILNAHNIKKIRSIKYMIENAGVMAEWSTGFAKIL